MSMVNEMIYEGFAVKNEDGITWITINRPQRLNSFTPEMLDTLSSIIDRLETDKEIRCVVFIGAGNKAFSTGFDVELFRGVTQKSAVDISRKGQEITRKIENSSKLYIAAINGYCLGGALELALSCDFRLASEQSEFGSPEIKFGTIPGWGGTQRLPQIVGLTNAKELVMLGERITAQEALRIGLVHRVFSVAILLEEAKSIAKRLVEGPAIALKCAKQMLNLGAYVQPQFNAESKAFGMLASTKDMVEGVSAFIEKRKPKFKGD